ncbi:hypothetical protein PR202_ga30844 [Eleusine coracana subsp. coracana]|uniref:Glycosyltransferase family 92 protein n=1 Tax=Eleusine coracana subsp. coracana TaxID=191504 RepID=A0AAV5DPV5_ELECO|nr:hypothetical protein PR202_ga30844 [Eleusine coracana subsp. coracana]
MAIQAKERKLSRLGSCKSAAGAGGGGLGSPAARGHRTAAAAGPQRRLFAALFAFLCAGVVVLGGVHVIGASFRPVLRTAWPSATLNAISSDAGAHQAGSDADTVLPSVQIRHAVALPDQILLVLKDGSVLPAADRFKCLYSPANSSELHRRHPSRPSPCRMDPASSIAPADLQIRDNSTIVFAKGMNLRPGRLGVASRYECVFGRDLSEPKHVLTSPVISAAQEVFRCVTPVRIRRYLRMTTDTNSNGDSDDKPMLVSIRTKGRGSSTLPSIAQPEPLPRYNRHRRQKAHSMCVCTMLRNQARFLREWIMYHLHIGVQRWFIYDNNSDDDIEQVLNSMDPTRYNVTRHLWPWMKSQEAGFAHCALKARESCEWVGFIDIDEFLHFPGNQTLEDVLQNYTNRPRIGELRTACHSFGPSGRTKIPKKGVMTGYTCRLAAPERHKSIVRPDLLNPSLINVVHHFHLKEGVRYVNIGQGAMLINHYKYQVWEVFKDKFSGRVATYVADWQDEENVGSRDRAPGKCSQIQTLDIFHVAAVKSLLHFVVTANWRDESRCRCSTDMAMYNCACLFPNDAEQNDRRGGHETAWSARCTQERRGQLWRKKRKLSGAAIAGIVVGVVVVALLLIVVCVLCAVHHCRGAAARQEGPNGGVASGGQGEGLVSRRQALLRGTVAEREVGWDRRKEREETCAAAAMVGWGKLAASSTHAGEHVRGRRRRCPLDFEEWSCHQI